jgi:hypothetical protein
VEREVQVLAVTPRVQAVGKGHAADHGKGQVRRRQFGRRNKVSMHVQETNCENCKQNPSMSGLINFALAECMWAKSSGREARGSSCR